MECSSSAIIHSGSYEMNSTAQIKEEPLHHNEVSTVLQEPPVSHKETYFEMVPVKSELIICDIKQDPWHLNETTADIKCDLKQPLTLNPEPYMNPVVIKGDDIKEEPLWHYTPTECRGSSPDVGSQNGKKESAIYTNESLNIWPSTESSLPSESICTNKNVAACFFSSPNTEEHIFGSNGSDVAKAMQEFSSIQHHKFEESKTTDANIEECSYNTEYQCQICGTAFNILSEFKKHSKSHKVKNAYKCDNCNKIFAVAGRLKRHLLIHTGERPFTCDLCNKSFTKAENVKQHKLIIHEGKRPYSCDLCNQRFTQAGHVKRHKLIIHEGKRTYSCDICNQTFTQAGHVKQHKLVIHDRKRTYSCDLCSQSFTQSGHLKRHKLIIHDGKRTYSCDVCNQSFTTAQNVKQHKLIIHEGKRPYSCEFCNKSFTRATYLKQHKLKGCAGVSHKPQEKLSG